jgi:hypothetical protein
LLLAWASSADHGFSLHGAAEGTSMVLTALCGVGVVLWARTLLPLPAIGLAYGVGRLTAGVLTAPGSENAWKFALSVPVTVIVLSLLARHRRPFLAAAALLAIGGLDVLNDARSAFGFCVLAAALVLWQARPGAGARPVRWWVGTPVLAALAALGYLALRQLLLAGVLGAGLQERTFTQITQTGSLILGGRPEWTATVALMHHQPFGFGLGTLPGADDVAVALAGVSVTRIPTVDGYLEHYMLDGGFELHSVVADLWALLGPAGLLLGLGMAALIGHALAHDVARRRASGLVCFLAPLALWSLAFGPAPSDLPEIALVLGLLLLPRPGWDDGQGNSPAVTRSRTGTGPSMRSREPRDEEAAR